VRSLVQPAVIRSAGIAALLTAFACYPRLRSGTLGEHQLWFVWLTLAWAAFILWSFVLAWHQKYTGQNVLEIARRPALWIVATLCGLVGAAVLYFGFDPVLRPVIPQEYPGSIRSWIVMTLFLLAFDQLFLCFAPFAFFIRLLRNEKLAMTLTVLFGIVLAYLKIQQSRHDFRTTFVVAMCAWRMVAGGISIILYRRGGVWVAWWCTLLAQTRHLLTL